MEKNTLEIVRNASTVYEIISVVGGGTTIVARVPYYRIANKFAKYYIEGKIPAVGDIESARMIDPYSLEADELIEKAKKFLSKEEFDYYSEDLMLQRIELKIVKAIEW